MCVGTAACTLHQGHMGQGERTRAQMGDSNHPITRNALTRTFDTDRIIRYSFNEFNEL